MAIEYQHVTGGWKITDYDSRSDDDPYPEQSTLKGRVMFTAAFDEADRFAAIRVPGEGDDEGYALSVRPMVFPVVAGRLQDRQARDGVWLPAVVAGVPIVWTATPELFEDPGRGTLGPKVRADSVTFGPADPDVDGDRAVDLANIMDAGTEYPAPVISRVAELVSQAELAAANAAASANGVDVFATAAADSAADAAESELAAADSASSALDSEVAAGTFAQDAGDAASNAAASAEAASGAGAARDAAAAAAGEAESSASSAAGSAADAADSAFEAAGSATDAGEAATRAEAAAGAAEQGAPAGGWTAGELSDPVRASLARADGALQDAPATVTLDNLAPEVATAFNQSIGDAIVDKADLGSNGQILTSQIPALAITSRSTVANRAALLALDAQEGDVGIIAKGDPDAGSYMLGPGDPSSFASWALLVSPEDAVQSVNGQVGPVNLGAGDVGAAPAVHGHAIGDVAGLQGALDERLPAAVVDELPASPTAGVLYLVREG